MQGPTAIVGIERKVRLVAPLKPRCVFRKVDFDSNCDAIRLRSAKTPKSRRSTGKGPVLTDLINARLPKGLIEPGVPESTGNA